MFGGAANTASTGFGGNTGGTTGFGGGPTSTPGFGGATNSGTASTPFSAFIEKDNASSANSHYQSITFMQPYQAFSFEELRLADYTSGRKFGNSNGQAGAFGQSTGFGGGFGSNASGTATTGFGASANTNTGGGIFGAQNTTPSTGFGAPAANTSTGFGGGGLFNQQNKPATGGMFGATPASSASTGSGLFGTTNNNTATSTGFGGFGQNNTQQPAQAATGGMFGAAANNTPKPAFGGGFGASTTGTSGGFGASTTGGFGQAANTNTTGGTGMFGQTANNTASPFGGAQQNNAPANNNASGSLFGGGFGQNNQNQQQQQPQTGTGSSLFGGGGGFGQNNQQKPNPFGAPATGGTTGSLFGATQTQQNSTGGGGLFGQTNNTNTQAQSGSLFGAKPATGGGLFGATQPQQNGMFGGAQPQQNAASGGMFGGQANQQKPAGSLFGNTNNQAAAGGSSLFGGLGGGQNQQQNAGGSLFGGSSQQQGSSNGMYGASTQQQGSLAATLLTNPYGNDQLFSNLGSPTPAVGPLATPLSGAQKPAKRPAALPQFKINPSASLRLITPQKRSNGYGFSYSTFGTPGSAQSFTSNGLGSSLLQSGGLSRSLGKSFSTSNLSKSFGGSDSVLAPGAFTPNNRSYTGGSIRRLKIDRNLRTDLFGESAPIEPPTKRVSFDEGDKNKATTNGASIESTPNNALVRTETDGPEPTSEDLGFLRAERPATNGFSTNGTPSSQARSKELEMVPEDGPTHSSQVQAGSTKQPRRSQADPEDGDYWMTPSLDELRNMPREQLKSLSGFTVGRHGFGKVEFGPVDLTQIPLDSIAGDIVKIVHRHLTVYEKGVNTPPMGKGLNVPSVISLENSWPRSHAGRLPILQNKGSRYEKYLERLRRVDDTEFISFDPETGVWVFSVEHFTTYGLDDDEDESDDDAEYESESMSAGQDHTPRGNNVAVQQTSQVSSEEGSVISDEDDESNPDDTFDFKKGPSKILPGSFGAQPISNDDEMADDDDAQGQDDNPSHLGQQRARSSEDLFGSSGSSNSPPAEAVDDQMEEEMEDEEMSGQDMAGSYPKPAIAAPTSYNDYGVSFGGSLMPKSILKASTMLNGTPKKGLALAGDWAEQLQRTASPKKQDRQALRERQSVMGVPSVDTAPPFAASIAGKAFSTTMDIMNSLWAPSAPIAGNALQASVVGGKGFEVCLP
jgi:nuclear pore complex protein Nup98-Nup96